jgi:hypothetical protein
VFYPLWSAKCKSIDGKALRATCKVHVICRTWLDLWLVIFCNKNWVQNVFYVLVFSTWFFFFMSSLLQVQLFNNASCLQCFLWGKNVGMEVWTMNTLHQHPRWLQLASKLMLHNLQHNTIHLLHVLVFGLLSFKVCMNNLYSSTTNGCLDVGSSCVLFAHFWWLKGNPESWANWKA